MSAARRVAFRGRLQHRWRDRPRVPGPLRLILASAAVLSIAWALLVPPFSGPDEESHFAYVQRLVEDGEIPWTAVTATRTESGPPYSRALEAALVYGGTTIVNLNPAARPFGTGADERLWRKAEARLGPGSRSNPVGFTGAFQNPPLYYAYAALPYLAGAGSDLFTQAYVLRLANLPFVLAIVALVWLIAGELLGGLWWPRCVAAVFAATQPALLSLSGVLNPDIVLAAAATAEIYAIVLVLKHGPTRWRVSAVIAAALAAALTHPRGYALLVPAALCLFLAMRSRRGWGRGVTAVALASGAVLGAAAVAVRIGTDAARLREFASYLWQFYLPRLPFMEVKIGPDYGFRQVFVERLYNGFPGIDASYSAAINDALHVAALALIAAVLAVLIAKRQAVLRHWEIVLTLLVLAASLLLSVHVVGFESLKNGTGDPVITARYLLPLISAVAVAIASVCLVLRNTAGVLLGGAVVWASVVLGVGGLGLALTRFYA